MATYSKNSLSAAAVVHRLWRNGLMIEDTSYAEERVRSIGYYRLLIYMRHFQSSSKRFYAGTKFSQVISAYEFDRALRLKILDAIERIEVAVRVSLSDHMSATYGPHWYMERAHFKDISGYSNTISKIIREAGPSCKGKSLSLGHYYSKYSDPELPPSWVIIEGFSFGQLSRVFESLKTSERKIVARAFGYDEQLLKSWLHSITFVRNVCAHHSRIFDNKFPKFTPLPPKAYISEFGQLDSLYVRVAIIWLLLKGQPYGAEWRDSLASLIGTGAQASRLGFPMGWETRSFWK